MLCGIITLSSGNGTLIQPTFVNGNGDGVVFLLLGSLARLLLLLLLLILALHINPLAACREVEREFSALFDFAAGEAPTTLVESRADRGGSLDSAERAAGESASGGGAPACSLVCFSSVAVRGEGGFSLFPPEVGV